MPREKLNVRQQAFGFPDEDLKTSLHDEIVLWLKGEKLELAKTVADWTGVWNETQLEISSSHLREKIEKRKIAVQTAISQSRGGWGIKQDELRLFESELQALESWSGPGDPGIPEIRVVSEMEVPITRERYKSVDIVGYADLVLSVQTTHFVFSDFPCGDYEQPKPVYHDLERIIKWHKEWSKPRKFAFDAKSAIPSLGELIRQFKTYRTFCSWPFFIVSPDARFKSEISDEGFGFIKYPEGQIEFPKSRQRSPD